MEMGVTSAPPPPLATPVQQRGVAGVAYDARGLEDAEPLDLLIINDWMGWDGIGETVVGREGGTHARN